jgi:glycosyltransferase involved in cell wall biosynthesis
LKKSILIITPRFPFPPIGGDRLRIYHICKELSKRYHLHLYSLCESKSELLFESEEQNKIFLTITRFYQPRYLSFLYCFLALFTTTPLQVAYYKNRKLLDCLSSINFRFDAVLGHLIRVFPYVDVLRCTKFLEFTDAISLNYSHFKRGHRNYKSLRSLIYSFEASRLKAYEDNALSICDASFIVSKIDAEFLLERTPMNAHKLIISSNGVDASKFHSIYSPSSINILFIGNMHSLQNIDAALNFCINIFPLVLSKIPSTRLKIIGRIKDSDLEKFKNFNNVDVVGEVEDIQNSVSDARVGICPMRVGAGVQNKVLEYLSFGLPTVTSQLGYEGFDFIDGEELLIANNNLEFSEKILEIFSNAILAQKLSISGRLAVLQRYDWETKLRPLVLALESTI